MYITLKLLYNAPTSIISFINKYFQYSIRTYYPAQFRENVLFYFILQVNNNGDISFEGQLSYYPRSGINMQHFHSPLVAPLLCDIDTTRNHGRVYYRATTDNATLQRASSDVSNGTDFAATFVFITTWHDVTFDLTYGFPVSKLRIHNYPPLSASNMQLWS